MYFLYVNMYIAGSVIKILAPDITAGQKDSNFGQQDMPSVEQIVRATIYSSLS
jgi:hypothetical protein